MGLQHVHGRQFRRFLQTSKFIKSRMKSISCFAFWLPYPPPPCFLFRNHTAMVHSFQKFISTCVLRSPMTVSLRLAHLFVCTMFSFYYYYRWIQHFVLTFSLSLSLSLSLFLNLSLAPCPQSRLSRQAINWSSWACPSTSLTAVMTSAALLTGW